MRNARQCHLCVWHVILAHVPYPGRAEEVVGTLKEAVDAPVVLGAEDEIRKQDGDRRCGERDDGRSESEEAERVIRPRSEEA